MKVHIRPAIFHVDLQGAVTHVAYGAAEQLVPLDGAPAPPSAARYNAHALQTLSDHKKTPDIEWQPAPHPEPMIQGLEAAVEYQRAQGEDPKTSVEVKAMATDLINALNVPRTSWTLIAYTNTFTLRHTSASRDQGFL